MELLKRIAEIELAGIPFLTIFLIFLAVKVTRKIVRVVIAIAIVLLLIVWYKYGIPDTVQLIDYIKTNMTIYRTPLIIR